MRLRNLELYRLRNLETQSITLPTRVALFVGKNGTGKTSLIESVYLLGFGRSFRTSSIKDLISWRGESEKSSLRFRVSAECEAEEGTFQIAVQFAGDKREIFLNDKKIKAASDFYGRVKVIEFSPDDLLLVKDAPAVRRQFLDRAISMIDPNYVSLLVHYHRALKNRNAILAQKNRSNHVANEVMSWTVPLVQWGRQIAAQRLRFILGIEPLMKRHYQLLALKTGEEVGISYKSHFLREEGKSEEGKTSAVGGERGGIKSETEILAKLKEQINEDLRFRTSTLGVHRDDFLFSLNAGFGLRPARRFASQGQMRSIVLALKFACLEYVAHLSGEWPILLLDDVESELDVNRREALFEFIRNSESQVMLTATDAAQIKNEVGPDFSLYTIVGGGVHQ